VSRVAARLSAALERAWRAGLLPRPRLERGAVGPGPMRDRAGWWTEPLDVLLASLRAEASLNPLGRTMVYGQISRALAARMRAERLWQRRPEVLDAPFPAPVVILGQMRSGTTRIHRLLACDPRFRHTRFFETMSPVPPRGPDLRPLAAAAGLRFLHALNPELAAVHPTGVYAAEEEFGLFSLSFHGAQYEAQWRVPGFTRYWEARSRIEVYAEFRMLMQTLHWARGGGDASWLLKAPQFMEDLDLLLGIFPDARLICLHRDPAEVVASSASLAWHQMRIQSDAADPRWIGREWLRKTVRRRQRAEAVRAARQDVPQLDVAFDAVNCDWRAEMRRIYDFLGLELAAPVEAAMAAYLAAAEASGFRGHRYQLADFGLKEEEVRNAFGAGSV
jgi:hypothetical protein